MGYIGFTMAAAKRKTVKDVVDELVAENSPDALVETLSDVQSCMQYMQEIEYLFRDLSTASRHAYDKMWSVLTDLEVELDAATAPDSDEDEDEEVDGDRD